MFVADLHCDTASLLYYTQGDLGHNAGHIDLEKLEKAQYIAQWFAYFIDIKEVKKATLMEELEAMHRYFLEQLEKYKDRIIPVTDYASYMQAKKTGKLGAFLSLEEGQVLEGKLENLEKVYEMGIRMMTLTWNYPNDLGAPHTSFEGLTPFGKEVVDYLNHLPLLIDISHLSESGVKDIRALYKRPIIASHCDARRVYNHTRNLSDATIKQVSESGGLIGINFYSYFLNGTHQSTIEAIVKHIDYLYQKGGEDCIALGTDFDGMNCQLDVCNCGEMDKLITTLSRHYNERILQKLCYENHERIIKEVL